METRFEVYITAILLMATTFGLTAFMYWHRDRRASRMIDEEERKRQHEFESTRLDMEKARFEAEQQTRYETRRAEEDRLTSDKAGVGSGGYIVMEMSENERTQFHDLLKGFEDYAKLKGYQIAFSIDATFEGRVAFKFTVKDDGVIVGPERVRADFKEYVEQVRTGKADDLDDLPVIASIEEHNLLIALLKNRISFLQHNLQLSKNAIQYYETLLTTARNFPALPAPTVVVQTGGNMDSRSYSASHSQRLIQGDGNTFDDSSVNINIGQSFNDRQERIAALDDTVEKLKADKDQGQATQKVRRALENVRDEIVEAKKPDKSTVKKWLEIAKNSMATAALGAEVVEAARKLFELFGLS